MARWNFSAFLGTARASRAGFGALAETLAPADYKKVTPAFG